MPYPIPENEHQRIRALDAYHLMDTPPERDFDRLAALASRLFNVPTVLVSLIDKDRQFFKARVGFNLCETSRDVSFCAHAIMQDDVLVILDAIKDNRFASNPLVVGAPHIRFYAGKPLVAPGGERIGTVCLIDFRPRETFSFEDRKSLSDFAALILDRMEMRRLDYVRSVSQARFENISATVPDALICSNSEGNITYWSRSAERLFGYAAENVVGHPSEMVVGSKCVHEYDAALQRVCRGNVIEARDRTVALLGARKDGCTFPAEFTFSTWQEAGKVNVGMLVRDITEQTQNEERLLKLASLDALTDLPNRGAWRECLNEVLAAGHPATILLLDLDGFKDVNDTLGHSAGDAVLGQVATRLARTIEDPIIVARLGGDEFVALLAGNEERRAHAIAAQLISLISQPYDYEGHRIEIGVSVGVSLAPQHGLVADELSSAADLALYRAKATGKGRYEIFAPALRDVAIARRAFERELKHAFENGEFELFYQPQFATADRSLTGAEALLRWNHPERGLLTPASFIEVLSHKPSAPAVGTWILRTACRQAARWCKQVPKFRMGVNLFEAQFRSGRLMPVVQASLAEFGLSPEVLELEIVETIALRNDAATLKLLIDLRDLGVGLAFDDYGTGYASLSLLKRYPVSRLKMDRSFIREVNVNPEDEAVVRAILYLGRSFGLEVIAEGVETEAQLDFLNQYNCPEVQGYLCGRPMPAAAFEATFIHNVKFPDIIS